MHKDLEEKLKAAAHAERQGKYSEMERLANEVLADINPDQSIRHHESLEEKPLSISNEERELVRLRVDAMRMLGIVAVEQGDYPLAFVRYAEALALSETAGDRAGIAKIYSNIGIACALTSEYHRALEYFSKALAIFEECGDVAGAARTYSNMGNLHRETSDYGLALEYFGRGLALHEELGDTGAIARDTGNIGVVYSRLSDYPRALSYYAKALALHEELGMKSAAANIIGNIGIVYGQIGDYPRALEYYRQALDLHWELGMKEGIARITGNMGNAYSKLGEYNMAFEYYFQALALHDKLGSKINVARVTGNIGNTYSDKGDFSSALGYYTQSLALYDEIGHKEGMANVVGYIGALYAKTQYTGFNAAKAEEFLLRAMALHEEIGTVKQKAEIYETLSDLYAHMERWKESKEYFRKFHDLTMAIQTEGVRRQAEKLTYERREAEREKLLAVEKTRNEEQQKLIHNMLPPEIAKRLLNNETFIADHYDAVSVLFMDLVNFTRIASIVPPKHLIYLLNAIFSAADAIIYKHNLEKIKTIGDAYMAVAGAPVADNNHASNCANAALELLEEMDRLHVSLPQELGGDASWTQTIGEIQVRIGLHCGTAIGGVIGDKKFSFDLWGDAVNTAARMEQYGEPGKVHISEDFAKALILPSPAQPEKAGDHLFNTTTFSHWGKAGVRVLERGEMDIKGKGIMRTFYLENNSNS